VIKTIRLVSHLDNPDDLGQFMFFSNKFHRFFFPWRTLKAFEISLTEYQMTHSGMNTQRVLKKMR
jgi:hypothetical protein